MADKPAPVLSIEGLTRAGCRAAPTAPNAMDDVSFARRPRRDRVRGGRIRIGQVGHGPGRHGICCRGSCGRRAARSCWRARTS